MLGEISVDGGLWIGDRPERTAADALPVIFEKKFSTALPGGRGRGECKVQRGWRASQASTLGCFVEEDVDRLVVGDLASTVLRKRMNST